MIAMYYACVVGASHLHTGAILRIKIESILDAHPEYLGLVY
jgi:hypothetical protein